MIQSVDFSMIGLPVPKSDLFEPTAGHIAYTVFSRQGSMSHNLAEPIPDTKELTLEGDEQIALQGLITSLETFKRFEGTLKSHFAFEELTKEEYEIAHALHIYNYFDELKIIA